MKRLYVDMDGTMARFHDEVKYLERMYEDGFFLSLKPFKTVVEAIDLIAKGGGVEIFILSSCVTKQCREEKKEWLKAHLPNIPESHYIFVDIGSNKALSVGRLISYDDVLLDDYNVNLEEWQEAGGHPIKLVNNINHKGLFGPLWQGQCVYERDDAGKIAEELKKLIA